jgi:hypothetical protein
MEALALEHRVVLACGVRGEHAEPEVHRLRGMGHFRQSCDVVT